MENLGSMVIDGSIINLKTAEIDELEKRLNFVRDKKTKQKKELNEYIVNISKLGED